jgi:hypothetical protein
VLGVSPSPASLSLRFGHGKTSRAAIPHSPIGLLKNTVILFYGNTSSNGVMLQLLL